jgi:hypothetical protein
MTKRITPDTVAKLTLLTEEKFGNVNEMWGGAHHWQSQASRWSSPPAAAQEPEKREDEVEGLHRTTQENHPLHTCEQGGKDHLVHLSDGQNGSMTYQHCPHTNSAKVIHATHPSQSPELLGQVVSELKSKGITKVSEHYKFGAKTGFKKGMGSIVKYLHNMVQPRD